MRSFAVLAVAAAFVGLGASRGYAADAEAGFDFLTHNEVQIAAEPAKVWPHLRDVNAWKLGAKTVHFDGGTNVVGERFKVSPEGAESNFYFIQTVELERDRRWTIRLNGPTGELRGYATWTLAPDSGGTRLRYDTFLRSQLAGGATPESTNRAAGQRMDTEFARLKRIVETAAPSK
jgi:hypothetical protein